MTDVMQDLLIDFDEMGFIPSTGCPNPNKYACEWKEKLVDEINCLQEQLEATIAGQKTLQKALAEKTEYDKISRSVKEFWGELEKLSIAKEKDKPTLEELLEYIENAKAEAIREFAERLKSLLALNKQVSNESFYYLTTDIDNLVKEMVGDNG